MIGCISTLYLNVSSFFPLFVEEHYNEKITTTMVAVILSTFEATAMLSAPINARLISKMGRKNAIIVGVFLMFIGTMMLGMTAYIPYENWKVFYVSSILARALQGYGDSLVFPAIFSMVT